MSAGSVWFSPLISDFRSPNSDLRPKLAPQRRGEHAEEERKTARGGGLFSPRVERRETTAEVGRKVPRPLSTVPRLGSSSSCPHHLAAPAPTNPGAESWGQNDKTHFVTLLWAAEDRRQQRKGRAGSPCRGAGGPACRGGAGRPAAGARRLVPDRRSGKKIPWDRHLRKVQTQSFWQKNGGRKISGCQGWRIFLTPFF